MGRSHRQEYSAVRKSIRRSFVVLFALHASAPRQKSGEKKAESVYQQRERIQREIDRCQALLQDITGRPQIPLEMCLRYEPTNLSLTGFLAKAEPGDARGFLDVRDSTDGKAPCQRKDFDNLSHIVEVVIDSSKKGWSESDNGATAKLGVPLECVPDVIVDIALDISMFHSFEYFSSACSTLTQRKDLSREKVKFLIENRYDKTCWGTVAPTLNDQQAAYVSFASVVRKSRGDLTSQELVAYANIWSEFVSTKFLEKPMETCSSRDAALRLTDKLKHGGQISVDRLARDLQGLENGLYVFALTNAKPNTHREREAIMQMIMPDIRRGPHDPNWVSKKWRIMRYGEHLPLIPHWPGVVMLPFRMEQ